MTATFYVGDAVSVMNRLPEKSVDLVLTSPPFLALRSYLPADHPDKALEGGSQATPGAFIDWLIDVVEACDRVLAPHGSLCIELGDTYAGSGGAGGDYAENGLREGQPTWDSPSSRMGSATTAENPTGRASGAARTAQESWQGVDAKNRGNTSRGTARRQRENPSSWPLAKSLSLIPELFRLTLVYGHNPLTGRQTDRWRLRNVVRWVRPNPPVGALGDKFRPATSELMVFCKSAKRYFDLDSVRLVNNPDRMHEAPAVTASLKASLTKGNTSQIGDPMPQNSAGAPPLDWWQIPLPERTTNDSMASDNRVPNPGRRSSDHMGVVQGKESLGAPLDWWNIPPGGYEGAHYAVFPPELCVKPVKAMCPEKVCRVCGEPSRRIVKHDGSAQDWGQRELDGRLSMHSRGRSVAPVVPKVVPTGAWTTCSHDDWRSGLVLDPFAGSGTTLMVATGHGRDAIGIDLDERNYELALQRVGPLVLSREEIAT